MNRRAGGILAAAVALTFVASGTVRAQTPEPSRISLTVGGASTTLRGDCQDCEQEGGFIKTGAFLANVGYRLNDRLDGGAEVFWVPATSNVGDHIRLTFVLATALFRPWPSRGFFLKGGIGMAFARNWIYDPTGALPPVTSNGLGLTYGAGWMFRRAERIGAQVLGTQHVVGLGDFPTGGGSIEGVIGNLWSIGAAVVVR